MRELRERETRLKNALAQVEAAKRKVRDKSTGRTRAQAAVKGWLEKLDTAELRHEAEIRGFIWGEFASIEHAIETIRLAMFTGVVVEPAVGGEPGPLYPEQEGGPDLNAVFAPGHVIHLGYEEDQLALFEKEGEYGTIVREPSA